MKGMSDSKLSKSLYMERQGKVDNYGGDSRFGHENRIVFYHSKGRAGVIIEGKPLGEDLFYLSKYVAMHCLCVAMHTQSLSQSRRGAEEGPTLVTVAQ